MPLARCPHSVPEACRAYGFRFDCILYKETFPILLAWELSGLGVNGLPREESLHAVVAGDTGRLQHLARQGCLEGCKIDGIRK
jgi:hypothetical protein